MKKIIKYLIFLISIILILIYVYMDKKDNFENVAKLYYEINTEDKIAYLEKSGYIVVNYDNLNGSNNYKTFEKLYNHKDKINIYIITSSNNIKKLSFNFKLKQLKVKEINNKYKIVYKNTYKLLKFNYDKHGYLTYKIKLDNDMKATESLEYYGIKIKSNSKMDELNKKYVFPIEYECNNLFSTNWNISNYNNINFNQLYDYLYQIENKEYFNYDTLEKIDNTQFYLPKDQYENIIQKYFDVDSNILQKRNYDSNKKAYLYGTSSCNVTHSQRATLISKVVDYSINNNYLVLTVDVLGYEFGYEKAFTHKLTIKIVNDTFKYISNEVVDDIDNNIPKYDF